MEYKFFINIDQCLNMDKFDFFFYRNQSKNQLHVIPNVYLNEVGSGISFKEAISNVLLLLNTKHIEDRQIIIAMRSDYNRDIQVWGETLLSRLISIDYELKNANVMVRSGSTVQTSVSLIMLYDSIVIESHNEMASKYLSGDRLQKDCMMLLKEIGVPSGSENNKDVIKECWNKYSTENNIDDLTSDTSKKAMRSFFDDLLDQFEKDSKTDSDDNYSIINSFKKALSGYNIFEVIADQQKYDMNEFFRIVEYITFDEESSSEKFGIMPLYSRCEKVWNIINEIDNNTIHKKYSEMLANYKQRLINYCQYSDGSNDSSDARAELPFYSEPKKEDIRYKDSIFDKTDVSSGGRTTLDETIDHFTKNINHSSDINKLWDDTYIEIKKSVDDLDGELEDYKNGLGREYEKILKDREKNTSKWRSHIYKINNDIEENIKEREKRENEILKEMNKPDIEPSLKYQDQLNVTTSLEQLQINVSHFISCIDKVRKKSFMLVCISFLAYFLLQYYWLQSYSFKSFENLILTTCYFLLVCVGFIFSWAMPIRHYKKCIIKELEVFKEDTDKYIISYYEKAKMLKEYANHTNQLDYIIRYRNLLKKTVNDNLRLERARQWHIRKSKEVIEKLSFFESVINSSDVNVLDDNKHNTNVGYYPLINPDSIEDEIDSSLYWPQG